MKQRSRRPTSRKTRCVKESYPTIDTSLGKNATHPTRSILRIAPTNCVDSLSTRPRIQGRKTNKKEAQHLHKCRTSAIDSSTVAGRVMLKHPALQIHSLQYFKINQTKRQKLKQLQLCRYADWCLRQTNESLDEKNLLNIHTLIETSVENAYPQIGTLKASYHVSTPSHQVLNKADVWSREMKHQLQSQNAKRELGAQVAPASHYNIRKNPKC